MSREPRGTLPGVYFDDAMKNFALLKESSPFYDLFDGGAVPILNIAVPSSVALEGSDEIQASIQVDCKRVAKAKCVLVRPNQRRSVEKEDRKLTSPVSCQAKR